jgi:hypothetical protein
MKKELAIQQSTTMYQKTIKIAGPILQSVKSNPKIGKGKGIVQVKKWRGMPMYQVTLVERETCPSTCEQWSTCYGNNSPFRSRQDYTEPSFFPRLKLELDKLEKKYPHGYVIRLHVLGDFSSLTYTQQWILWLARYQGLHIFGYTHHKPTSRIGKLISQGNTFTDRFRVRFSDSNVPFSARVETLDKATGIVCPEQTGKTESCLTCGLCWAIDKPITFLPH